MQEAIEAAESIFQWAEMDNLVGIGADEVVRNVFLCGERPGADRAFAQMLQVRLVLCCNAVGDWPTYAVHDSRTRTYRAVDDFATFQEEMIAAGPRADHPDDYRTFVFNIAADDSPMYDLTPWFTRACDLLETAVERHDMRCLVHCMAGVSRSATIVAAYLMRRARLPAATVITKLRARRGINPNPGFVNQLERWDMTGYAVFDSGNVEATAEAIAGRLKNDGIIAAVRKLRSYVSVLLTAAADLTADRAALGILAASLARHGVMPKREFASQVLAIAGELFENDEAVDTPLLPGRVVEAVAALNSVATDGAPLVPPAALRLLVVQCACGMGDQFGFNPKPLATMLRAVSELTKSWRTVAWVHIFAARIRTVLEAGSPVAFSWSLKINWAFLDLQQTDDWTPALQPFNTRRVLAQALASFATMGTPDSAATTLLLSLIAARVEGSDDSMLIDLIVTAIDSQLDAPAFERAAMVASVVVALESIGDPLPNAALALVEELDGGLGDELLCTFRDEARDVLERCSVSDPAAILMPR
jgi:hypothetical protein